MTGKRTSATKSQPQSQKHETGAAEPLCDAPVGFLALHILQQVKADNKAGLIVICKDEDKAEQLGAAVHAFGPASGVMVLPSLGASPFDDLEPARETAGRRSCVLRRLADDRSGLLITTADAVVRRVPAPDTLRRGALRLEVGDAFEEAGLRTALRDGGYILDEPVEMPGMALFLGQTLEVFPAGALAPVRISGEDGRITAIHGYNIHDGREDEAQEAVIIDVVDEADAGDEPQRPATSSVFAYLPQARVLLEAGVDASAGRLFTRIGAGETGRAERARFISAGEWEQRAGADVASPLPGIAAAQLVDAFAARQAPAKALRAFLADQQEAGRRVVFTAASRRDLKAMDRRAGAGSTLCADWQAVAEAPKGSHCALLADLDRGFVSPDDEIAVVTASDVLGSRASHQDTMNVGARRPLGDTTMALGDVVIHTHRGLAVLRDLVSVSTAGMPESEMIKLEFADEDFALVGLPDLRAIWRYSSDLEGLKLDKADGSSWIERRDRVAADIRDAGREIRQRIAERQQTTAVKLVPPAAAYEAFAAGFGYRTTVDQGRAVGDVLADLASGQAMDRLVCGDVGYGKTEVALRAAAAAVLAGKQVAIVVPTTVLAQQHLRTFRARFAPFGIEVGELSRFTSAAEARTVKKALADGSLQLVVGTHALAGKAIRFADLGLVVIDEEQHFGRAQKEKLASLSQGTHLLTMSATPIPRTLSEARMGLRSLSLITTPPVRRFPVKTIIEPFHEAAVAAALRREQRRRGQSFVVCPRIEDIEPMAQRLRDTVPELRTIAIHGRMPGAEVDSAMMAFAAGEADVLLATNIIESGLDFPRANTIVVWRPDRFGIGQLHQLRGRVGRGSTRAFALFLTDPDSDLTSAATKRLTTLEQLQEHNSGFLISSKDLDIRGGGDLLSDRQSGHIQILGRELSEHLLARAVGNDDAAAQEASIALHLNLDIPVLLPRSYVQNDNIRLALYARLFKCRSDADLDRIEDEIEERFGDLPPEATALIEAVRLELACLNLGITELDIGSKSAAATFAADKPALAVDGHDDLAWKDGRLIYQRSSTPAERLGTVRAFISLIAGLQAPGARAA